MFKTSEQAHAHVAALLHSRAADLWLARWGGLHDGLPLLPAASHGCHDAGLRDVVGHLLAAGRADDVHRLLLAERDGANVWFDAHERRGLLRGYRDDVNAARKAAAAQTDRDLAAGRLAPSFGRELRYRVLADQAALTQPIDGQFAARLVESGRWTTRRAIVNANALTNPADRCRAFAALLPAPAPGGAATATGPTASRPGDGSPGDAAAVLGAALEAATASWQDGRVRTSDQAALVALLGPHLTGPQLNDVIALFTRNERDGLLASLVPYLPAGLHGAVLDAVAAFEYPAHDTLLALAPRLTADLRPRAKAAIDAITDPNRRGTLLLSLYPAQHAEALALFRTVEYPIARRSCLIWLLPFLPADDRAAVAAEALALSDGSPQALRELAPYIDGLTVPTEDAPTPAVERLERVLPDLDYENYASTGIGRLAPHLPEDQLVRVIRLVRDGQGPSYLGRMLTRDARHYTGVALAEALDAARGVTRAVHRARALAALAAQLPAAAPPEPDAAAPPEPDVVYAEAVAAAREAGWIVLWAEFVEELPVRWRDECLAEADACRLRDQSRPSASEIRTILGPHVVTAELARAIARIRDEPRAETRIGWFAHAFARLPSAEQRTELPRLLADLRAVGDEDERARLCRALARHVPLADLVEVVLDIDDEFARGRTLAELAPTLPARFHDRVLDTEFHYTEWLAGVLAGLAPRLNQRQLRRAAQRANAMTYEPDRIAALAGLVPHLPPTERAAAFATILTVVAERDADVGESWPLLTLTDRAATLTSAETKSLTGFLATLSDPDTQIKGLRALIHHLPADAVDDALALARTWSDPDLLARIAARQGTSYAEARAAVHPTRRADGYTEVAAISRDPDDWAAVLAAADAIEEPGYRALALQKAVRAAAQHPSAAAVYPAALAAAAAIEDAGTRGSTLACLAGDLPADQLEQLLAVARDAGASPSQVRTSDAGASSGLVWTFNTLARRVPAGLVGETLAAVRAVFTRDTDRMSPLLNLAPRLPDAERWAVVAEALAIHPATVTWLPAAPPFGHVPAHGHRDLIRAQRAWRRGAGRRDIVARLREEKPEPSDECAVFAAAAAEFGGVDAAREYVDAILDVYRWWP